MHTAVLGSQWGDEGKGKIVDLLAKDHDIIVRCQGGNNAGHTVVINNEKHAFHLLPSAILHPDKMCVLGNGMVIDPDVLTGEIKNIKSKVGDAHANLMISDRAHMITPEHIETDLAKGKKVGTTGRGIGPTYAHKINRAGTRYVNISAVDYCTPEVKDILTPLVADTGLFLHDSVKAGKKLLFEGAQATMLDIDHGTYPFVTSSNCSVGGLFTGSGIFVKDLEVIGVLKAYTTRVGNGPMVTELFNKTGEELRAVGQEFGTTTGRPRRCGWLDTVVSRYSARINGLDGIALTKLDVLTGISPLKICDAYVKDGERMTEFPADLSKVEGAEGEYIEMTGWTEDITKCRTFEDLPKNAQDYVRKIEDLSGVRVKYIGVGPNRDEIIIR